MPQLPDLTLPPGSVFEGRYEILSELGGGNFGRVYKARQLSTAQAVAIKLLRFGAEDAEEAIDQQTRRFRREMQICAELPHPHIVRLIDSGEAARHGLYAVFEFVPGKTLEQVLADEGALELPEAIHLMTQVLDALACMHRSGVVHRDLKPANIMITDTGMRRNALVLDFGLGGFAEGSRLWGQPSLTQSHEFMGTPSYASPEQLRGEMPSVRSDLYSWGLVLLECLTGQAPADGAAVMDRLTSGEPLALPAWLEGHRLGRLLQTVTARELEKRDVTHEGLLQVLEASERAERSSREAPRAGGLPYGERRQVTLVSCHLSFVPLRGVSLDIEEGGELRRTQHALCEEVAGREGGQVVATVGDRVMLQFGYPQTREDDARRACRAALEIAAEIERRCPRLESERGVRVSVRIGIHSGLVITREVRGTTRRGSLELAGATPEVATALDARAGPGEVLLSADTQRLLRGAVATEALPEQLLDGLEAPSAVFRLSRGAAASAESVPLADTPLLGRSGEMGSLLEAWHATRRGAGRSVLISGDAGIGKSRLLRELRRQTVDHTWLECRCLVENSHSPLRPVVDLLTALGESIDTLLPRDPDSSQAVALQDLIAPVSGGGAAARPMSRERQKELTLQALVSLVFRKAEEQPVVFVVEDLQWADPTSLELFGRLVQELQTAQLLAEESRCELMIVCTARSEFEPPWPPEAFTRIQLQRLPRDDVAAMIEACVAGRASVSRSVLEQIVLRADGIPLFVEEVSRVLVQQEDPFAMERLSLQVPPTLRDLLRARLDALSPDASETAQLAAALGREFRYEVLRAVSPKDDSTLRGDLRELMRSGLLLSRRSGRGESYLFKHALLRDAAYETMLRPARQDCHARIAHALLQRFPEYESRRPELLALHFGEGGEPEVAVQYWARAGDRASARGAYAEAIAHATQGLEVLKGCEPSRERIRNELTLTESLGTALLSTRGYAAAEVEQAFGRARELCRELGEEIPIRVLFGTWGVPIVRGDKAACDELIPHFQRLAEVHGDPVSHLFLHSILGTYHYVRGDFQESLEQNRKALEWHANDECQAFVGQYGYDTGMHAFGYLSASYSSLGHAEEAIEVTERMLALAEEADNPYSLAIALGHAMNLRRERGEHDVALAMADRQVALAMEQRLFHWLAPANVARGWVLAQRGEVDTGIATIQQGLDLWRALGAFTSFPYLLCGMAEAQLLGDHVDAALAAIDEGLELCATRVDRSHEGELLRLKGECLLRRGEASEGEAFCRRALDWARERKAVAFELRAARSLARLLAGRGEREAARELLRPPVEWYAKVFDILDVVEGRKELAALE